MAAIVPVATLGAFSILRSAVSTAQTDWVQPPAWARRALVFYSVTTAGTNSILTISAADPALKNDAQALVLFTGATITVASNHLYVIGDRGSSVAEVADGAAADAIVLQDELAVLPPLLGLGVAVTAAPVYTLSILFRS